jgi:hypothetical protein
VRADLAHFEQHKLTIASKVDLPGPRVEGKTCTGRVCVPGVFPGGIRTVPSRGEDVQGGGRLILRDRLGS